MDEQEQQLLGAVKHLRRMAMLATLAGGAVVAVGVVLTVVNLVRGQAEGTFVPLAITPFGIVFAIGGRIALRSFLRMTVRTFQNLHGSTFSDELRWELESLNVPREWLEPSATTTTSAVQREPQQPPHVVDHFTTDGAVEVAFRWGKHSFHVMFGDAMACDTGDVDEPWRVQLGIRRRDDTEIDYGVLDDLIQCSPHLRFRFDDSDLLHEPDEWFGGDPCTIAGQPGEMDLAMYFEERPRTMELVWMDDGQRSLGKLPVREVER